MAFSSTGTVWMNGKLVNWTDANVHVASHVLHYGSAVFEGARDGALCSGIESTASKVRRSP